jgi:hypothetical protein
MSKIYFKFFVLLLLSQSGCGSVNSGSIYREVGWPEAEKEFGVRYHLNILMGLAMMKICVPTNSDFGKFGSMAIDYNYSFKSLIAPVSESDNFHEYIFSFSLNEKNPDVDVSLEYVKLDAKSELVIHLKQVGGLGWEVNDDSPVAEINCVK